MTTISTAAWIVHNLGLSTSIGGTLFGQGALQPALEHNVDNKRERATIADEAWSRYSVWNLAAHGVVAATWFAGRSRLSGREINKTARRLTLIKDVLILGSLATGIASVVVGKKLGASSVQGAPDEKARTKSLRSTVKMLGAANIASNVALVAVTTSLSMQSAKSLPFKLIARLLP